METGKTRINGIQRQTPGKIRHMKLLTKITAAAVLLFTGTTALAGEITLIAVGDIMPAARALPFVKKHGFGYPFEGTREVLQSGDIVIGNLEAPLTTGGKRYEDKEYTFKAPIETAAALKDAGFTHLSLANNHMMDYGPEGLTSTLAALDDAGLLYAGAGENIFKARAASITEINGKKIAFLSFSKTYPVEFYAGTEQSGTAPGYKKHVTREIKKAREAADIVIVAYHWGGERLEEPRDYQKEFARLSIDSGADVVLGHHPHVLQGVEYYKDGVIFYSLGNFAFGSYSPSSKESIIARIVLEDDRISRVEAIPINVNNFEVHFKPSILKGKRGEDVISNLDRISKSFDSTILFSEGRGIVTRSSMLVMKPATEDTTLQE